MKKIRNIIILFILSLYIGGCANFNEENIEIVTTSYPIEYLTSQLYSGHAIITSIYPDSVNITEHTLTDKQIINFSNADIFIYNGLSDERKITIDLLEKNKNLNIIDSAYVLEYNYNIEELWLDPSNLLMMGQNIKIGLKEYINNSYLQKEIEENYDSLKVILSELDAKIKSTVQTATNKTIISASNSLKFLEKYGLNIITVESSEKISTNDLNEIKALLENNKNRYIYNVENNVINEDLQNIINSTGTEVLTIKAIDNLTEEERENNQDYITLMNYNIELLKKELYQ